MKRFRDHHVGQGGRGWKPGKSRVTVTVGPIPILVCIGLAVLALASC